ncbi:helix-turn-helix domain-containing protein [Streptomyces stelliscabiei]|uniref:helix-turn-helix domain-containing protein n=1 Tax=Streptomyces stelliscabiei TaxID=146820 RepID=UPI0038D41E04
MDLDTVRCWRGRFVEHGPAGLSDRERSGRPVVHRVAGGPGQGPGLPAASRARCPREPGACHRVFRIPEPTVGRSPAAVCPGPDLPVHRG